MAVMTVTRTRVHIYITFANPYLTCGECGIWVTSWHNAERCGCDAMSWINPCRHSAEATSVCPSWGPLDDCKCNEVLGAVSHEIPPGVEDVAHDS